MCLLRVISTPLIFQGELHDTEAGIGFFTEASGKPSVESYSSIHEMPDKWIDL